MRSSPHVGKYAVLALSIAIVVTIGNFVDKAHALSPDKEAAIKPVELELRSLPTNSRFFTRDELLFLRELGEPIVRTKRWQADTSTMFAPIYRARNGYLVLRYRFTQGSPAELADVVVVLN